MKSLLILLIFSLSINQVYSQTKFAIIGDFGEDNAAERDVADLVNSWNVDFIITTGDNSIGSNPIDENIGKYYSDWIGDYKGSYGSGSSSINFYPALGNHDYDDGGGLDAYLNYFTLPGNELYYDFVRGNVHFFIINSITDIATQEVWLQTQMENCKQNHSHWEVVCFHHPPYSSGSHGSTTRMRWAFKDWGAHFVVSGHDHDYERINVDSLVYFVNGTGGRNLRGFGSTVSGSEVRYNSKHGAQLVTADGTEMRIEFYNINGELIDSWTIQQSSPDITPPQLQAAVINNPTEVVLSFSESLDSQSAQNTSNYSIDNGISVISAILNSNNTDVTLTTTEHSVSQQYTVTVTNVADLAGNVISSQANSAQYFYEVDTTPPQLLSASSNDPTQVVLVFSENLDSQSAQNVSNYNINNGINVTGAVLNNNNTDVTLTTSTHDINQTYTATVSNVTDLAGNVISPDNNSADYQLIILSAPVFPVDLFGTPESEKTVNVNLSLPGNMPDLLTYHLIAFDADHGGIDPPEGHAFINGNGPLELFPGATQENGDRQTNSFEFTLPSSWWVNGANELKFIRLYSTGYRIDSAFISSATTDVQGEDKIPNDFALAQNYPNPFNPSTTISFSLPVNSRVKLSVYNLLGQMVEELVNDEFSAGTHTLSFNADGLTSGIYFYKLEAGAFLAKRKMILLR